MAYEHAIHSSVDQRQASLGELEVVAPERLRGQRLVLHGERAIVGRDGSYAISSPLLSRQHIAVTRGTAGCLVEDLGSTNGSWLNDVPLSQACFLINGARLRLGSEVEVVYHGAARASRAETVPRPPVAAARSETTRYLAASTHLNRGFRKLVLRATVRERHRAVCPSHGVDLSVVARHAVLAERRELVRDLFLVLILAASVLWCVSAFIRAPAGASPWDTAETAAVPALLLLATSLVASFVISAAEGWTRDSLLAKYLLSHSDGAAAAPFPRGAVVERLNELVNVNHGNVVVSSLWEPFVGSGERVDLATFAVSLLPDEAPKYGGTERLPIDFTAFELLDALEEDLSSLALSGLQVGKLLMVDGVTVRRLPEILPNPADRPLSTIGQRALRENADDAESLGRTYLCAEAVGWGGELIVNSFTRVVHAQGSLFVEISAYVMYPVKPWLRQVDSLWIRSPGERAVSVLGRALRSAPLNLLASPGRLWSVIQEIRDGRRSDREHRRYLYTNTKIDYGAHTSIRQTAMDSEHPHFFVAMDAQMYVLTITDRLLKRLVAFLEERGYATTQIKNIQNNYDFHGAPRPFQDHDEWGGWLRVVLVSAPARLGVSCVDTGEAPV